jgi:hypothetical protein
MKVEELEELAKDAIRSLRHVLDKVPEKDAIIVQEKMKHYLMALHTVARGLEIRANELGQTMQKILNYQEMLHKLNAKHNKDK